MRARHVHGSLVRLQGDQRVFSVDVIAFAHGDFDDLDVIGAAKVRHLDVDGLLATAGFLRRRGRFWLLGGRVGFGLAVFCGGFWLGIALTATFHFQLNDIVAFGDFIALFHQHFDHLAAFRGRYIHAGFVGFQSDQGVFRFDDVAF